MEKGFTLIETLVVIVITLILVGILVINFPKGKQQFILQNAAQKLAQQIRGTQEMAMSAQTVSCESPKELTGFGIYFNQSFPNSYIIFKNCDFSEVSPDFSFNSDTDEQIGGEIDLEEGVRICSLSSSSSISIVFSPPSPTTHIVPNADSAEISICLADTKTIKVNRRGLIEIGPTEAGALILQSPPSFYCGDNACDEEEEDCNNCPNDCGICSPLPPPCGSNLCDDCDDNGLPDDFCGCYPNDPSCPGYDPCLDNPNDPACPGYDPCVDNPNQPSCPGYDPCLDDPGSCAPPPE